MILLPFDGRNASPAAIEAGVNYTFITAMFEAPASFGEELGDKFYRWPHGMVFLFWIHGL